MHTHDEVHFLKENNTLEVKGELHRQHTFSTLKASSAAK
jgi:hypothetical protein